jgi:ribosome-binding protein aMBF1 (putative translation factor)
VDDLGAHRLLCGTTVEGQHSRGLLEIASLPAAQRCADVSTCAYQRDMRKTDQSTTGQVRNEERHGRGIKDRTELASDSLRGFHR